MRYEAKPSAVRYPPNAVFFVHTSKGGALSTGWLMKQFSQVPKLL